MLWALLAFAAGFFDATYYAVIKKHIRASDPDVLAAGFFLISATILGAVSWYRGVPTLDEGLWTAILVTAVLNVAATMIYFRVFHTTDISLAVPMLAFSPVFLMVTSNIILGEAPSAFGAVGICLVVAGAYLLHSQGARHLLDPFRNIWSHKGVLGMLIVTLIYSVSSNFDKLVVLRSDPFFGFAIVQAMVGATLLAVAAARGALRAREIKRQAIAILPAVFLAFSVIAVNIAYSLQIVPYVISIKRVSILFGVMYGVLLFKEKAGIRRMVAGAIMVAGVATILLL